MRPVGVVKGSQRGQRTIGRHLKDCPITAASCRPRKSCRINCHHCLASAPHTDVPRWRCIEKKSAWSTCHWSSLGTPFAWSFRRNCHRCPTSAPPLESPPAAAAERNQRGQRAIGRHLEHRPSIGTTARGSRAVEIAIIAQRQRGLRRRSIGAAERHQRGQRTICRHFEHRSKPRCWLLLRRSRAVEITIIAQRQGSLRNRPIGAVERHQRGQRTIGRHFEHRPIIDAATALRKSCRRNCRPCPASAPHTDTPHCCR